MLRLLGLTGEELVSLGPEDLDRLGNTVKSVKQHLHILTGYPRFRLQLTCDGRIFRNDEVFASADLPAELTCVKLGFASEKSGKVLLLAAQTGNASAVETLLHRPIDPNAVTDELRHTPLHLACKGGHLEVVSLLLEAAGDTEKCECKGNTALHEACVLRDVEVARLLLQARAAVNKRGLFGNTPLHLACQAKHPDMATLLLEFRADKDVVNCHNDTPLHEACAAGHTEVARALIEARAAIDVAGRFGFTPLLAACKHGRREAARLLLDAGADKDRLTAENTPLIHACSAGLLEEARLLIKARAEVNKAGRFGYTPLYLAWKSRHPALAQLLIDAGADLDLALMQMHVGYARAPGRERGACQRKTGSPQGG